MRNALISICIILFLSLLLNFYLLFKPVEKENKYTGEFIINYNDVSYKMGLPSLPTIEQSTGRRLYHRSNCEIITTIDSNKAKAVDINFINKYNFLPCKSCNP